jgi:hypothetical protein
MESIADKLNSLANDIATIELGGRDIETKERLTEKELAQLGSAMRRTLTSLWFLLGDAAK